MLSLFICLQLIKLASMLIVIGIGVKFINWLADKANSGNSNNK